ncbi:PIK3AP1 [Mytilus coruscus]|uniref:PIK3AP1 n=1 Tax=Mytilus coruscus TaxID=42192 RepID=A0A6J8ELT3_MYTCO|nr:PIK3AP1 [Mytilus coruscus]
MEFSDVGIFCVFSDGKDWANFLQVKLAAIGISSNLEGLENDHTHSVYAVNVVLATPAILDIFETDRITAINADDSVMVLLGVDKDELKLSFAKHNYKSISKWKYFETKQTEKSVSELVACIQLKLEAKRQASSAPEYDILPPPRPSQAKLRHAEPSEFVSSPKLQVATTDNFDKVAEVFILSNRKGSNEIDIFLNNSRELVNTKAVFDDKALYQIQIPENAEFEEDCQFVAIDNDETIGTGSIPKLVEVTDNVSYSKRIPTKSDIIRETLGFENDPVPLVCQMLEKDNEASNWRPLINEGCNFSKCPTLLHFAAEYNLKTLGSELLKLPESLDACFAMNKDKNTPQAIAQNNEFPEFAQMIRSFMKVETLKGNIQRKKDSGIDDDKKLPTIPEFHEEIENNGKEKKPSSGEKPSLWSRLKIPTIMKTKKKSSKSGDIADINSRGRMHSTCSEQDLHMQYSIANPSGGSRHEANKIEDDAANEPNPNSSDHHLAHSKSWSGPGMTRM